MDANGQRFWMLADEADWRIEDAAVVRYDTSRRSLALAEVREAAGFNLVGDPDALLALIPQAIDAFGSRAFWDDDAASVMAIAGALDEPAEIAAFGENETPTDLAMGFDGILYAAVAGRVELIDRRGRWSPAAVPLAGFDAFRLTARPEGGVWVLDRTNRRLGLLGGEPLLDRPAAPSAEEVFRRCVEDADPPTLHNIAAAGPDDETPVAIAASPGGKLALLTWRAGGQGVLRLLEPGSRFGEPIVLAGSERPYSLAWLDETTVAVMLAGVPEAPAYRIAESEELLPSGGLYPLRGHTGGPFLNGITLPPHYPTAQGTAALRKLSLRSFAKIGRASNRAELDSGASSTTWHRVYLEARIPVNCGVRVFLAATNQPGDDVADEDWFEHRFGAALGRSRDIPSAVWVSKPSELPFHPGMTLCRREPGHSGLFTVLVQRGERRVRSLVGRYLRVRVELSSDGRETPEIWALRAYGSRFSYVNRYLPELYRETEFGPARDDAGRSTPPDFLERFIGNFEGVLTPLEDRIAASYLLTDARTVPDESLEWLANWIGVTFDPVLPGSVRRSMLQAAPDLARRRGTVGGLTRALDIATGGAVAGGEIVVIEDFRMRRTFATILGAHIEPEKDPLLTGIGASGNSFVGDTLFLGEEHRKEFLAIFGSELEDLASEAELDEVTEFLSRLSNRATVLVHDAVSPQDFGLIRRIVELEAPAHVAVRIAAATKPFIVEIASLVGVETYLGAKPARQSVRLGKTQIGRGDVVRQPPSLDPRIETSE